jgi:FAD/FMN-containing dehydrogenase
MKTEELRDEIKKIIEGDVSLEEADIEHYARDTSLFYVRPRLVVFPKHKDDVQKLVQFVADKKANGEDITLTARAAGTCMTGGPLTESIVFDATKYMNHVTEVTDTYAVSEPGVFYRDFEPKTLEKGWIMPSYPASRELAAIGGIICNNSGGEKTLVYGKTENFVKEMEVVYANGETDTLKSLTKEELEAKMKEQNEGGRIHRELYELINANYDTIMQAKPTVSKNSSGYLLWNVYNKETGTFNMPKLITGSQGTLAMMTRATITGIVPKKHRRMLVVFIPSTARLGEIVPALLKHEPETMESYDDHTFKMALKFFKDIAIRMGGSFVSLGLSFLPEFWMVLTGGVPKIILMAEFAGDSEEEVTAQRDKAYEDMKQFNLRMRKTQSDQESKKYWTFRRESFALLRKRLQGLRTAPVIDDICVHPRDLPEFLPKLETIFAQPKYSSLIYTVAGHMGDANFHIVPLVNIHEEGIVQTLHQLMDEVYGLVVEYKGSISAEHNDGLLRTPYLPKMFNQETITLFEKVKDIFDPKGIFNPRKKVHGDMEYSFSKVDRK